MASDRPSRLIVLRVKPKAQTAMNDASTLTGSARPVITVERQELRNRKTTSTVSAAPSIRVCSTLLTALPTRLPASWTISSLAPGGRVWLEAVEFDLEVGHHLGGAVPLRLLDLDADRRLAVEHRGGAGLLGAVDDVGHLAQADHPVAPGGDHDLGEILRPLQPALEPDRLLIERRPSRCRPAPRGSATPAPAPPGRPPRRRPAGRRGGAAR